MFDIDYKPQAYAEVQNDALLAKREQAWQFLGATFEMGDEATVAGFDTDIDCIDIASSAGSIDATRNC